MRRALLLITAVVMLVLVMTIAKGFFWPSGMWEFCYATLEDIDVAKQYWASENNRPAGSAVVLSNLCPRYLRETPRCPRGGTYNFGRIGEHPVCSVRNNPWHQRHYFLNYSREEFVTGKRVRFMGQARNVAGGPVVENGQRQFVIRGLDSWSLLERNRKVTVFGTLSGGPHYVITNATYQRGYFVPSSYASCIAIAKQVDGAKEVWALENQKSGDDSVCISELLQQEYFRELPHCDSGGIYIIGKVNERPTCTLHGDVLGGL